MENQFNYKAAFDIAKVNGTLPTFKFGTDENSLLYTFKTVDEFEDFYQTMTTYIFSTLNNGWKEKAKVDWKEYQELLG